MGGARERTLEHLQHLQRIAAAATATVVGVGADGVATSTAIGGVAAAAATTTACRKEPAVGEKGENEAPPDPRRTVESTRESAEFSSVKEKREGTNSAGYMVVDPVPHPTRLPKCDPPFVINAEGRKIYKKECL